MAKSEYGKIEYSLGGLGFILNALLGFGIPSSYAYFVLKKEDLNTKSGYSLYILLLIVYFILIQALYFVFPKHIYLSLIISYVLANQVFYSYVFKAQGQAIYATLMDSGIYFLFLGIILINYLLGSSVSFSDFFLPMLLYSCVFAVIGVFKNRKNDLSIAKVQLIKIIKYSWHLLIGSFLIILLMNSGRFIIEFFSENFEDIGVFGFYLRIAGISLVIFQMLFILYFKEFYTKSIKSLDKMFSLFLIIILIYSVISLYLIPVIIQPYSRFFKDTFPANAKLFVLLTFFTFFWTTYNLISNMIVREKLAQNYNYYLVGIIFLFSLILVSIPKLNIEKFAVIQLIIGVLVVISQQVLLFTKGIVFKKTNYVIVAAIFLCIAICISF
ncbi:hypothetical protein R3X28_01785 [Maribacter sp. TH_r10]|uniref:hypothetical protein n=1 Tax=Maribacter sp. TH_r10 TaxID=3082086 RepID=UPI0029543FEB|nr:hypothetical protein [Maribacter sp. TH_r10]MDV7137584.1 hypothetical protein [Maribacter sp. TH_r10]